MFDSLTCRTHDSAADSSWSPAEEHIGEQVTWPGLHMLWSRVQASAHGGQLGGQLGGSRSISAVGGEPSRRSFSKERSTFLILSSLWPVASTWTSSPLLSRLICWNLIFILIMASASHPLIYLFSIRSELSHTALFFFFYHLLLIKVNHEKSVKGGRGPGMRQICLAFTSHNDSQLNSHINCWSPVWMVPLVVVLLHMDSRDPADTFSSCPWLQSLYVTRIENGVVTGSTTGCCLPDLSPS